MRRLLEVLGGFFLGCLVGLAMLAMQAVWRLNRRICTRCGKLCKPQPGPRQPICRACMQKIEKEWRDTR